MANTIFNVARGMIGYYATLPGTNDALVAVPIEATGLEADDVLVDHDNLNSLLAGSNNEQTTAGRKTLAGVTSSVNDTSNVKTADSDDITWASMSGNPVSAIVICYIPDTTVLSDFSIIPLVKLDASISPSGTNVTLQMNVEGFYKSL